MNTPDDKQRTEHEETVSNDLHFPDGGHTAWLTACGAQVSIPNTVSVSTDAFLNSFFIQVAGFGYAIKSLIGVMLTLLPQICERILRISR